MWANSDARYVWRVVSRRCREHGRKGEKCEAEGLESRGSVAWWCSEERAEGCARAKRLRGAVRGRDSCVLRCSEEKRNGKEEAMKATRCIVVSRVKEEHEG